MKEKMSLQTVKEKSKILSENLDKTLLVHVQGSRVIVPFSRVIARQHPRDIYTGEESIPFEKRDPLFKSILRKEFSNAIQEFIREIESLGS